MNTKSLPLIALTLIAATPPVSPPRPLSLDNPAYTRTPRQEALIKAAQGEQCPNAATSAPGSAAPSAARQAPNGQSVAAERTDKAPACTAPGGAENSTKPPSRSAAAPVPSASN